jgi:hypothetical protein
LTHPNNLFLSCAPAGRLDCSCGHLLKRTLHLRSHSLGSESSANLLVCFISTYIVLDIGGFAHVYVVQLGSELAVLKRTLCADDTSLDDLHNEINVMVGAMNTIRILSFLCSKNKVLVLTIYIACMYTFEMVDSGCDCNGKRY